MIQVPSTPPVYIQRNTGQTTQQLQAGYWYYCRDPEGYYPTVRECPDGWEQVSPRRNKRYR